MYICVGDLLVGMSHNTERCVNPFHTRFEFIIDCGIEDSSLEGISVRDDFA